MRTVWSIAVPIAVALLTTVVTNRVLRPTISLQFEPSYPMVIEPKDRPFYGDRTVAIKIESDATLKDAFVRLLAISKNPDLSRPLNSFVEPRFGWPALDASFQPRTIGGRDYILVASERDIGSEKHLMFFLNEFMGVDGPENKPIPELEFLRDLQPGVYYMEIELLSESAPPASAKFKLVWDAKTGLEMSILK